MLKNRRVVAVAYDGLCAFEFGIATELFGLARPEFGVPWYEYRVVAASSAPIRAIGGIGIRATADLRHVRAAGTIVLPGWKDKDEVPPAALLAAIRNAHEKGARVMSICSGVYVLAAAGLLDGLAATTHWRYAEHLADKYPMIDVQPNVLYVDNGSVLTSAGSAAGIDLGLHLIRRDYGATIAAEVARRLIVPPQREGGQAQYIRRSATMVGAEDKRLATTMSWVLSHLHEPLAVSDLAFRSHMSSRTFARRFLDENGVSPLAWILTQRVRLAQELLETTAKSIDEIATLTGFSTAETLRYHFRRELNTSPTRYRHTFTTADASMLG
jgi:AraC family transcriptional regulator, transcriptional activator FtrA